MNLIGLEAASFSYRAADRAAVGALALDAVSLSVGKGEFVALLGGNGSGKSTLVKMCNASLLPDSGAVRIGGIDTRDEAQVWEVRRSSGMIFQDPDSQIIGTTVAEDVAFGPENLGLAPRVIQERVRDALQTVGMRDHAGSATHSLTPLRKILVSLAGLLAMQPECILLDEAAAMLDPADRLELLTLLRRLNGERGIAVLLVTHDMEEAASADRVVVLDGGKIVVDGEPARAFLQVAAIREAGLRLPLVAELFHLLNEEGLDLPEGLLETDEALRVLATKYRDSRNPHADQG